MSEILRKLKESKEREEAELASKAATKASKAAKQEKALQEDGMAHFGTSHVNDEVILQDEQTGQLYIIDDRPLYEGARLAQEARLAEEDRLAKSDKLEDRYKAEIMRIDDFHSRGYTYEDAMQKRLEERFKSSPGKEITIDTLRGLYWMATPEHVGDKKMPRGQLKSKLNDLLLTKAGMRMFLKSLEEFVFS